MAVRAVLATSFFSSKDSSFLPLPPWAILGTRGSKTSMVLKFLTLSFAELKGWSGLFIGESKVNRLITLDPFSYKDTEEMSWNFVDLFHCLDFRVWMAANSVFAVFRMSWGSWYIRNLRRLDHMDFLSSPILAYCLFGIYVFLAAAIFLLLCLRTNNAIMSRQLLSLWSFISAMTVVLRSKETLLLWLFINILKLLQSTSLSVCITWKMIFSRLLPFTAFYDSFLFCRYCLWKSLPFVLYFYRPDHGPSA